MGHREHRLQGPASVPCAVLTVSDTRDESTDTSGAFIRRSLRRAGHAVVDYRILKDEPRRIVAHLRALARREGARVVLLTGGTGIAPRDSTFEADRKSTRLNSSHDQISYAVFCLKKKKI